MTVGIPDGQTEIRFSPQGKNSMKPLIENETLSWIGERRTAASDRFRSSLSALTIVLAVGWLASVPAAGQDPVTGQGAKPTAATKTTTWKSPRTPDGQPDLQGVWVNKSATPFERPKSLEGRPFLTDDEVAELKRRADRLFKDGDADLPVGDNLFLAALANPEHFRNPNGANRSSAVMIEREFDNRTSLLVDPRDGRIPAL